MKICVLIWLFSATFAVCGQDVYENDLFVIENEVLVFNSAADLVNHLKVDKPSTYLYFERLNNTAQKRVFELHQANTSKDITEIVLFEYRKR